MDTRTDIHLTQGDPTQNMPSAVVIAGCEHEYSNITRPEDPIPENSCISAVLVHVGPAMNIGDVEVGKGQSSIHTSSQEYPDMQLARNGIYHKHDDRSSDNAEDHTLSKQTGSDTSGDDPLLHRCDSNRVTLPPIPQQVHLSELPIVPAGGPASSVGWEAPIIIHSQEPSLLLSRTASETTPRNKGEGTTDSDDTLNRHAHATDTSHLTDEEDILENLDRPCDDFASSQLPSSSPPQLFSSSPCGSSQSSVGDIKPSKTAHVGAKGSASTRHYADHESNLEEPRPLHDQDAIRVVTSAAKKRPSSLVNDSPRSSQKRMGSQSDDEQPDGQQPAKRLKPGSHLYLPPAPMRATLVSQNRQFKKLAAPFRPPSKLPVARDELAQTTEDVIESVEVNHDTNKPFQRGLSTHVLRLQHKVSNASRSATQFKSPLINRVLSADNRTIRLTPALQALERKLQLLKRAVKVKEDNEEEVLTMLAGKWIEAGREVAYDVWDATKDATSVKEKPVLARRSFGWENTNKSWGWDTKREDVGEESGDPDSSIADPLDAEEDDEGSFHNTLGTMLRQLGIAPEIFGWDDDKEAFCD